MMPATNDFIPTGVSSRFDGQNVTLFGRTGPAAEANGAAGHHGAMRGILFGVAIMLPVWGLAAAAILFIWG